MSAKRRCIVEYMGANWPVHVPLERIEHSSTLIGKTIVVKLRLRAFKFAFYEAMPAFVQQYLMFKPSMDL